MCGNVALSLDGLLEPLGCRVNSSLSVGAGSNDTNSAVDFDRILPLFLVLVLEEDDVSWYRWKDDGDDVGEHGRGKRNACDDLIDAAMITTKNGVADKWGLRLPAGAIRGCAVNMLGQFWIMRALHLHVGVGGRCR